MMSTATKLYNDHELSRFISAHVTTESSTATMTSMGTEVRGKWKIPDEKYPKFLDLLHDYLFVKHGRCMNFVEQPRKNEPKPLLIDLDFRYPDDTSLTRAFALENIESFTHLIVKGLDTIFGVEAYEEIRFFVTLRPAPYTDKGKRKDGVHILCPDVALSNEKQSVLRNWLLNENAVKNSFQNTGYVNPDDDVYDESMTRQQGWIFYGESKPNIAPYKLEAVFSYKPTETDWIDEDVSCYSSRDLMELLSVRYNIVPDTNAVKPDAQELYDSLLTRLAPLPEEAPVETGLLAPEGRINTSIIYQTRSVSEQHFEMIKKFVMECLKEDWYEKYDKWIRVGWCLHNIAATEEMFKLWMDFSKKSGKSSGNNEAQLRTEWFCGMRKNGDGPRLTERSLRKWARDDSPEMYNQIIDNDIYEYIREEVDGTHYHIARLMKKIYGNTYVASVNTKSTDWYKYDEDINMWKRLNQGIELKGKISVEVSSYIDRARATIPKGLGEKQLIEQLKELIKIQMNLYNNGFTEGVMKMAMQQFHEEDFTNKLNIDPFLFGCRNGILELRTMLDGREHVIFRPGRPEDYVSFLAGRDGAKLESINYVPYDATDPRQAELDDFFAKLFPRKDLRAYVLRLLSSCLEGVNREQCYYTMTGVGGNGKSKLIDLCEKTLGDYVTSVAPTVLTRNRPEAGAANPEIMVTKCKRFIYMTEPDEKEPINTSIMKQFSGEDMVSARALYGDQDKFRIMGKIFMLCNNLPPVTSMDEGTWRRIRVIPFESKFKPPEDPELILRVPNVFPRDPKLDEKIIQWREPFLSRLVHIYETEYIPNGLNPIPESVQKASNKYKNDFDIFARFESERIREPKTIDQQLDCRANPVDIRKVQQIYNSWVKESRIARSINKDHVIERLRVKYGEPQKSKWSSFKIFESDEEVTAFDNETLAVMD